MDWDVLQVWGVVERGFLSKGGHWGWVGASSEPAKLRRVHEGPCPTESSKWGLVLERLIVLGQTFSAMVTRWEVFMRRVLELHVVKMVALYTVWVALEEVPGGAGLGGSAGPPEVLTRPLPQVSLMNFLLVLLWALAMPYCRFRHMASCLSTIWTCIIIVCKMLYQLKVVDPEEYSSNCTQVCPAGPVLGGLPGWRRGLGGPGALSHALVLPLAAPAQQHQPGPGGAGQLHAVP